MRRPVAYSSNDYAAALLLEKIKEHCGELSGNVDKSLADIRKVVSEEKSILKGRLLYCAKSVAVAPLQRFGEVLLRKKEGLGSLSIEEQQTAALWVRQNSCIVCATNFKSRERLFE